MCRGAQGPHMHLEFVGQELQGQPLMRWSLRRKRLCAVYDGCGRGAPARIPRAECFDGDAKRGGAFRLRELETCPDCSQDRRTHRCRFGSHRWSRCHPCGAHGKRTESDARATIGQRHNWPEIDESTSVGTLRPVAAPRRLSRRLADGIGECAEIWRVLARPAGLEPATLGLEGPSSEALKDRPIFADCAKPIGYIKAVMFSYSPVRA